MCFERVPQHRHLIAVRLAYRQDLEARPQAALDLVIGAHAVETLLLGVQLIAVMVLHVDLAQVVIVCPLFEDGASLAEDLTSAGDHGLSLALDEDVAERLVVLLLAEELLVQVVARLCAEHTLHRLVRLQLPAGTPLLLLCDECRHADCSEVRPDLPWLPVLVDDELDLWCPLL